jgi:hypothetical protein
LCSGVKTKKKPEQKPEQKSIESESPKLLTHVKPKTIEEDLQERIRVANLQEQLLDATSKVEAKNQFEMAALLCIMLRMLDWAFVLNLHSMITSKIGCKYLIEIYYLVALMLKWL